MDRFFYVKEILLNTLLPFVTATFPDNNYRFQPDNDLKHMSKCHLIINAFNLVYKITDGHYYVITLKMTI